MTKSCFPITMHASARPAQRWVMACPWRLKCGHEHEPNNVYRVILDCYVLYPASRGSVMRRVASRMEPRDVPEPLPSGPKHTTPAHRNIQWQPMTSVLCQFASRARMLETVRGLCAGTHWRGPFVTATFPGTRINHRNSFIHP